MCQMSSDREADVLDTRFFSALRGAHTELFQQAAQQQWMIAVPPSPVKIDEDFIKAHILQPELTAGSYTSCSGQRVRIHSGSFVGLNECPSQVLAEHVFYNHEHQPYRVVRIDRPLDETQTDPEPSSQRYALPAPLHAPPLGDWTHLEAPEALERFAENLRELCALTEQAEAQREETAEALRSRRASMVDLRWTVHTWAMQPVLPQLLAAQRERNAVLDEQLNAVLIWLQLWPVSATLELLDVPAHPVVDLSSAVLALEQFAHNSHGSVLQQLTRLQDVTACIIEAVRDAYSELPRASFICDAGDVAGADMLVPLLIGCIVLARPPMLVSALAMLEMFQPQGTELTEYGFHLCNLQVAVMCLLQPDMGPQSAQSSAGASHAVVRLSQLAMRITTLKSQLDEQASATFSLKQQAQQAFEEAADELQCAVGYDREVVTEAIVERMESLSRGSAGLCEYNKLGAVLDQLEQQHGHDSGDLEASGALRVLVDKRKELLKARDERDRLQVEHAREVEDRENLKAVFLKACVHVEQSQRARCSNQSSQSSFQLDVSHLARLSRSRSTM